MKNPSNQVFILGAPRSGTTFLASLLGLTRFGKPFETHFITKYFKLLPQYGDLTRKQNFKKLLQDILKERPVMQWNLDLDLDQFYEEQGGDFAYGEIVNKLCLKRNGQLGLEAWGDKTPHYIGDFDIIYSLFPDARFIFIVRDGRDVALSLLQKNWGPNNIYACARYWKKLHRHYPEFQALIDSNQMIEISYEDLLDNTEQRVRDIYAFLDQSYDESDLAKLCSTVKPGNYFKWKQKFSKRQTLVFDYLAADVLERFGYEVSKNIQPINPLSRLVYAFHDRLKYYIFMLEINVIDGFKIRFMGKKPFAE